MRKTGSREPRDKREASVTSPSLDRGENFFDPFRIAAHPAAEPPENALEHDGERDDRNNQDRPHDRAALAEIIDQESSSNPLSLAGSGRGGGRRRRRSRAQSC